VSSSGNFLGTLAVRLHSELADPAERIALTKREADLAKAEFKRSVGARAEDYLDCLPPIAHVLLLRGLKRQVRRGKPMMGNVGMSNVPGPSAPLYVADFKIEALYGVGPLAAGHGLNITAWTFAGQLNVSFLASSDSLPDLWPFVGHFRAAFEEIRDCSAERTGIHD
jgi:diacylglycerol O-acyltransferase